MAARTKRQMVDAVLGQLRVKSIGETPSAEDYAEVAGQYDDLFAELRDLGLCYWTNTGNDVEEIPQAIFRALANILASDCSDTFGKQFDPIQDNDTGGGPGTGRVYGIRQLRRHMHKRSSGEQTPFSSY